MPQVEPGERQVGEVAPTRSSRESSVVASRIATQAARPPRGRPATTSWMWSGSSGPASRRPVSSGGRLAPAGGFTMRVPFGGRGTAARG